MDLLSYKRLGLCCCYFGMTTFRGGEEFCVDVCWDLNDVLFIPMHRWILCMRILLRAPEMMWTATSDATV